MRLLLAALSVLPLACGGQTDVSAKDGGAVEASSAATPAKGGGVCCPVPTDPCGVCGVTAGGWAASASDCVANGPCDGNLAIVDDSHGCPYVAAGDDLPGAVCCGCPGTSGSANPTCFEDAGVWHCPQGDTPQCPADVEGMNTDGACELDAGTCFFCSEGAGSSCSCAPRDGGGMWVCVGAGIACQ